MKTKILVLIFLIVNGLVLLTSCPAPPPPDAPYISINQDLDTVFYNLNESGTKITFSISMESDIFSDAYLSKLVISENNNVLANFNYENDEYELTETFEYIVPDTITSDTVITLLFEVSDSNGRINSDDAKINVTEWKDGIILLSYNDVLFQGCSNNFSINYNMFDAQTGILHTADYTPAIDLDLAYLFYFYWENFIASPDAYGLVFTYDLGGITYSIDDKNTTHICKVTSIQSLNEVTEDFLKDFVISDNFINDVSTNGIGVSNLQVGDFVAFETEDGYKGLFEIKALSLFKKGPTTTLKADFRVLSVPSSGKE